MGREILSFSSDSDRCLEDVAGLDVGLTLIKRTSGVCRTGPTGELVTHTYIDHLSRATALGLGFRPSVLAIDAPVLPEGVLHYETRPCEKVFVWGGFQSRCKCGESQVRGTGQALRRAGVDTAQSFAAQVSSGGVAVQFPRIFGNRNIVEAFPNAFLGVALPEELFEAAPSRGEKFDWLYDRWVEKNVPARLRAMLDWPRDRYWETLAQNTQHDERAAIICALTAICVLRGSYVAVGEPVGGYFFLPPWPTWSTWARRAVNSNRSDQRLPRRVDIWIDGSRFGPDDPLPS